MNAWQILTKSRSHTGVGALAAVAAAAGVGGGGGKLLPELEHPATAKIDAARTNTRSFICSSTVPARAKFCVPIRTLRKFSLWIYRRLRTKSSDRKLRAPVSSGGRDGAMSRSG